MKPSREGPWRGALVLTVTAVLTLAITGSAIAHDGAITTTDLAMLDAPALEQLVGGIEVVTAPSVIPVSPEEAYSAPFADGALGTEEVNPAASPGTPAQLCWETGGQGWHYHEGYLTQHHGIFQDTYWCSVSCQSNGRCISYRRSWDTVDIGYFCGTTSGPDTWRTNGGIGYPWVYVRTEAEFACQIPPWWFHVHRRGWMRIGYNAWGQTYWIDGNWT